MDVAEGCREARMVGVAERPDVDTSGRERGIGVAEESDSLVLASVEDCGEGDGTKAVGSSSDSNSDHV